MAYGIKGLRKIQIGREAVAGVADTVTTVMRMEGAIEDDLLVVFPPEAVGIMGGVDRSYIPSVGGTLPLEGPATFEQLPHILEMGIKAATASADGGGSDYIYEYPFPITSQNACKTYTVEAGNNAEVEQMVHCYVPEFTLSGKVNEALMVKASIKGRQVTVGSFSASTTIPTVEEILMNKGSLYIDTASASAGFGATQISSSLLAMELKVETGFKGQNTADGVLYYGFVKQATPKLMLDLTFEHEAQSVAQKVLWRSQALGQLLRLKFVGSGVVTPGTVYSVKTVLMDFAGKWEKFTALTDDKGDDTIKGTFHVSYDSVAAAFATITVVNELSALP